MATPGSSFTPTPQGHEDNLEVRHHPRANTLQASVAATNPGCKKELIRSASLGLLKNVIESKFEDGLSNIVIMLRIFLTSAISNGAASRS
ncbi:hypothetical protein TNCV_1032471 [Trichonephila clavipes]|nr:hypothetical protein TNCV_1032471 [Trichonephila clavipes]